MKAPAPTRGRPLLRPESRVWSASRPRGRAGAPVKTYSNQKNIGLGIARTDYGYAVYKTCSRTPSSTPPRPTPPAVPRAPGRPRPPLCAPPRGIGAPPPARDANSQLRCYSAGAARFARAAPVQRRSSTHHACIQSHWRRTLNLFCIPSLSPSPCPSRPPLPHDLVP
jgi:hypothetical protein